MSNWKSRHAASLAFAIAVAMVAAPAAAAHVTIDPDEAEQGSYAKLTFRVPNERDNASTTRLEVTFPSEHPLSSVSVKPHPGWTVTVGKQNLPQPVQQGEGHEPITETVRTVTWTAEGKEAAIAPGEFDEFEVSAGRLPEGVDEMIFKAVQVYDSGEAVRWIEVAAPGAAEPEHPAPELRLVASESEGQPEQPAGITTGAPVSGTVALVVSVIALLVGAVGLVVGISARRRT